jgi:predicted RNase H-like nuclease
MTQGHPFAVLGIDAAWTERNPSGVALIEVRGERARAIAAAPSYGSFRAGHVDWAARPPGGLCDPGALLDAANRLTDLPIVCVAVDMALSRTPITGRRVADNVTSAAFARQWCGTHSPSRERPGRVSEELLAGFRARGFELAVKGEPLPVNPVVEVHPHGALVRLLKEERRLPYKLSRLAQYHPEMAIEQRRARLLATWRRIADALEREVAGSRAMLPASYEAFRGARLKAVEDTLDAIICAWIGAEVMRARAEAFGDETAAIWVPRLQPPATTSSRS